MEFSEIGKGRGKSNNRKLQFFVFAAGNNEKTCKTFSSSCPVVFPRKVKFPTKKTWEKSPFPSFIFTVLHSPSKYAHLLQNQTAS